MAEKRMFSQNIIESDAFTDMPAEAQMLYVHLSMNADDDGFCDKPRQIMRQCGASNDSMKLLVAKKFVLTFEKNDGFIVVIKHWRMNNYIRKDTYRETKYKEFMRELYYDENQSYSMNPGDGHIPCLLDDPSRPRDELVTDTLRTRDESLTQNRIDKKRKEKNSTEIDKLSTEEGESEGEPDLLTDEHKKERIDHFRKRIEFFRKQGWDPVSMYSLALNEGITAAELDSG